MVHEVRLREGAEAILQRPISDAEFAAFDATYAGTTGTVDQRLNSSFETIADSGFATDVRNVISYYQVFLGRQPDPAGLNRWTDALSTGELSLAEVADRFATAPEYMAQFAGQSNTEIVTTLYLNVLGRQPDTASLNEFVSRLDNNEITLADLGRLFATSPEAQIRLDAGTDAFLLNLANGVQDFSVGQTIFQETVVGASTPTTPTTPTTGNVINIGDNSSFNGTAGNDTFAAESGDLTSSDSINGGGGDRDTLTIFNETGGDPISPRIEGVEVVAWTEQTNDSFATADNNVGGRNNFTNTNVELDAGRIEGVTRWENFDSRADLVIEDARDDNDIDGTFTEDLTIAMVSTDPGNVDYAIYFDNPVNEVTAVNTGTLVINVLDQEAAVGLGVPTPTSNGFLTESFLQSFSFNLTQGGEEIMVELDDVPGVTFGPNVSFADLLAEVVRETNEELNERGFTNIQAVGSLGEPTPVGVGNQTTLPLVLSFNSNVFTDPDSITVRGRDNNGNNTTDPFSSITADAQNNIIRDLITLNVELDDVGKGSTGGDLLAGAMSTGRQALDDGTSDSQGIQRFDIEVDRSSNLQTINSTNNALEVVNITNGLNDGPNATAGASDQGIGDLTVRGRANPFVENDLFDTNGDLISRENVNSSRNNVFTDNPLPGALPQHDDFGFSDVRFINASLGLVGAVDLTVDLTDRIVDKYLDNSDTGFTGDADDVGFRYELSNGINGNDEFLLNASASALLDAGSASREDFNLVINGNAGNDNIVTNIGEAAKFIDANGQDAYTLDTNGAFYANQANNDAATIVVTGGSGNDSIWTNGWGDASISAGFGEDIVFTDNSGTVNLQDIPLFNSTTNSDLASRLTNTADEHQQIDYQVGAMWTFNDDAGGNNLIADISGSTNDGITLAAGDRLDGFSYNTALNVSFFGAGGSANADTAYVSAVTIAPSLIGTDGLISDQEMTQAIKRAINDDAVLSQILEAVDGPGQSLAVYSKIDGDFVNSDLAIDLFETVTNTATGIAAPVQGTNLDNSGYDTSGGSGLSDFQNFGSASIAESDNTISVLADDPGDTRVNVHNDVTVLSTNDSVTLDNPEGNLNGASNENILIAEGRFGTETIFNFDEGNLDANDGAEDRFDFQAIDFVPGTSAFVNSGGVSETDNSINIIAENANGSNNTEAAVADLFTSPGTNTTVLEHIVIIFDESSNAFDDTDNTGSVYLVTNPTGAGATTAAFQGEINLIGTEWLSLEQDNFL